MDQSKKVPAKVICARFGDITPMTLWRWLKDPNMNFPQPIVINRRRYFELSEIEAWERNRASQAQG